MVPLLLAAMSLASSTITPDIDVAHRGSLEVNAIHLARLRDFLQSFSAISPPEIERGRWGILGWLPTVSFRFDLLDPERSVYVEQDAQNGIVYFFRVSVPYDAEKDTHEPMERFLSAQKAFEEAVPILKHFRLSTESSDYQIEPYFGTRPTLAEGSWSVKRQLTYNGVECYKCWVEVLVRAATKEVELVSYRPPLPPRPVKSRITKDEASDAVRKWLKEHWYFSKCARAYVDESQDITEIIVIPPEYKRLRTIPDQPFRSSYCWLVPVKVAVSEMSERIGQVGTVPIPVEMDTGRILIEIPNPDSH